MIPRHLLSGILTSILLAGCAGNGERESSPAVFLAFDVSGSMIEGGEDGRRTALRDAMATMADFDPDADVTVFRFGNRAEEVHSGTVGGFPLRTLFGRLEREILLRNPPRGTNLSLVIAAAADWAARYPGRPLTIRIYTDGGDDATDPASRERLTRAAKKIAAAEPKEFAFVGVDTGCREKLRKLLPTVALR